LAIELGVHATHEAELLNLQRLPFERDEQLARRLCDFDGPLDALQLSDDYPPLTLETFHEQRRDTCLHPMRQKSSQVAQAVKKCWVMRFFGALGEPLATLLTETRELSLHFSSRDEPGRKTH